MKRVLRIDRSKWISGWEAEGHHVGNGDTSLLNSQGFMCCLGFACNQAGVPKNKLKHSADPSDIDSNFFGLIPELVDSEGGRTDFCKKAININDNGKINNKNREIEIRNHFKSKNIRVVFFGKYNNKKTS